MRRNGVCLAMGLFFLGILGVSCQQPELASESVAPAEMAAPAQNKMVRLLAQGKPIFGVFSGPKTPEQAATLVHCP